MIELAGRIHDSDGNRLAEKIMVEAFMHHLWGDKQVADPKTVEDDGSFILDLSSASLDDIDKIHLVISDPLRRFVIIRQGQNRFKSSVDNHGNTKWTSTTIDDTDKIDITVTFENRQAPDEYYEAVVIGSGFGGTIAALTLANKYAATPDSSTAPDNVSRVCILERGQWWVSHEMPSSSDGTIGTKPGTRYSTIREYLKKQNVPYALWAYPDNFKGLLRVFANTRTFNPVRGFTTTEP